MPWSSFDTIVDGLLFHRRGNAYLAKKNNWSLDRNEIANEVDAYNAAICIAHGWTSFVTTGDDPPKPMRPRSLSQGAGVAVAGAKNLTEWLGQGGTPVPKAESERRAHICAGDNDKTKCPKNQKGDWTRFFTVPASASIKKLLSIKNDMALTTPHDESLGVCSSCGCPLTLKVHEPMTNIVNHMTPEVEMDLDPRCWIRHRDDK